MNFEFQAPSVSHTEEPFRVSHENQEIGEIRRYFKKAIRTTQFDVNLIVEDYLNEDKYEIEQTDFKMSSGGEWVVKKNDKIIGEIKTPKGFFKVHQIVAKIEGQSEMKFKAKFDGSGKIIDLHDNVIGQTKRSTSFKRVYEGNVQEDYLEVPLILFYGLLHTFWCGFNRN